MSMDLERREFVAAGATALGGALAGCSGDDEDENGNEEETPTEADNEQPDEPLGIDHVRFAAEEPSDYREYEKVENATYTADEIVWIYYEPVGFAVEDAGDGEGRIDLDLELTVTEPSGTDSASFDEEIKREILPEADRDDQWLVWSYQPATGADPGEYTAELTIVDQVADEEVSETVTFTIEGEPDETGSGEELRIADALLIAGEPEGSGEYEPAEDSTYTAGETIWIYYDPVGVTTEDADDGEARVDIHHELTVTGPSGQESTFDNDIEQTVPAGSTDDRGLWWNYQLPASAAPGEYTAEITLVDELGGEEAIETVTFTIEGA